MNNSLRLGLLALTLSAVACAAPASNETATTGSALDERSPTSLAEAVASQYVADIEACEKNSPEAIADAIKAGACLTTATDTAASALQRSISAASPLLGDSVDTDVAARLADLRDAYKAAFCGDLTGDGAKACAALGEFAIAQQVVFVGNADAEVNARPHQGEIKQGMTSALVFAKILGEADFLKPYPCNEAACAYPDIQSVASKLGVKVGDEARDALRDKTASYCAALAMTETTDASSKADVDKNAKLCAFSSASGYAIGMISQQGLRQQLAAAKPAEPAKPAKP